MLESSRTLADAPVLWQGRVVHPESGPPSTRCLVIGVSNHECCPRVQGCMSSPRLRKVLKLARK